jgi:hypothetical protein
VRGKGGMVTSGVLADRLLGAGAWTRVRGPRTHAAQRPLLSSPRALTLADRAACSKHVNGFGTEPAVPHAGPEPDERVQEVRCSERGGNRPGAWPQGGGAAASRKSAQI